nr:spore germination protein [Paenibacillus aceti]
MALYGYILDPNVLNEVRKRIKRIDVDGLFSVNQLEEALSDVKYPIFPLLDTTGRPDYAVNALLAGRFVIVIDGNPLTLIGPATFGLVLKSPEDVHFGFQYVSFVRLIRLFSFWMSILLPGLWVALTAFHQDQIPFQLMATISSSRQGLPFSAQMEMFILLLLLEIFREAGVRLPTSIGQTLTVIGALVIGDAAIRAGLVSPSVVVVGSITAVMGVTLVNQTLSSIVSVLRFVIFLISSFVGMYGLILSMLLLLFYMSRAKSFGVPYLAPLSPPNFKDILKGYLRLPWNKMRSRPDSLNPIDPDHQGEDAQ